ncbi:MAG: hypothetical protein ACI4DW_12555 [Lachnospiraceae bacterium]
MRKLTEDELDEINRENSLKANIIKWWNVIVKNPDQPDVAKAEKPTRKKAGKEKKGTVTDDAFSEDNKALYESILKDNNRDGNVYQSAMENIREEEEKALEEANRIYERLMREAQMDEEKKLREIEAAKIAAEVTENK